MTQYVAKFPLPDLASSQEIVQGVRQVLAAGASEKAERRLNHLVWQSFGLVEEITLPHSR
jgi:hypothetical protein